MKKALLISTFILLSAAAFAQNIRQGRWHLNGTIITRPNDSTQIEEHGGEVDTLLVEWLSSRKYLLKKVGKPTLAVTVTRIMKHGYAGIVTDGKKEKYFELIKIK